MESAVRLTAIITRQNDRFVARAVEVDVTAGGQSIEESLTQLGEALELYFEDRPLPTIDPDGPIISPVNIRLAD
jgi:predicted RNase H-like HicB family nuclease